MNLTQPRLQGQAKERFVLTLPTLDRLKSKVGHCLHPSSCFPGVFVCGRGLSLCTGPNEAAGTLVIRNRSIPGHTVLAAHFHLV